MAKKEFTYRGKTLEQLQAMSNKELAILLTATARRKLARPQTSQHKLLEKKIKNSTKTVKTHCRDMLVLPYMVGKNIKIYTGKTFEEITIQPEMIGHLLGEFALSRKRVGHSAPGVGATRSSTAAKK